MSLLLRALRACALEAHPFSSRFIDWVIQFKAASAIKLGEVSARPESVSVSFASSVGRDRDLHEAHLLMLVGRCDVTI